MGGLRWRAGDLFAPVRGRRFDRIAANPPYNPSLDLAAPVLAIHGGVAGDEIPRRIVAELADHLTEDGAAHLVARFFYAEDRPLPTILDPAAEAGAPPLGIHLLQTPPRPVFTLANLEKTAWPVLAARAGNLFDTLRSRRITRESFGVLSLRRAAGAGFVHVEETDFDRTPSEVQIPTQSGHLFRFDSGHHSDAKAARVPA